MMQIDSKDWGLTLQITRSFIERQDLDYYKEHECTGLIISRGFVQQQMRSNLVTLPKYNNNEEMISQIVLERYKAMESSDELPDPRFLYSFIKDVQALVRIRFKHELSINDMLDVLIKKSADYGCAFRSGGFQGIRFRIWEKISRYFSLSSQTYGAEYEPLEDSLKDILGYLIILLALTQE
jgi:hypothetical protein